MTTDNYKQAVNTLIDLHLFYLKGKNKSKCTALRQIKKNLPDFLPPLGAMVILGQIELILKLRDLDDIRYHRL